MELDIKSVKTGEKMIFKKLKQKLSRYSVLATGDFEKIFKDFKVPSLPDVVTKIMTLLRDPEASLAEIASLLRCDPGLASQILQMVNSAYLGLSKPIANLNQAVNILGLKQIETLVISYGVTRIIKDPRQEGFDLAAFWTDSLLRALFARKLVEKEKKEETFLAALLQDISLPVLLNNWFDVYQKAYLKWQKNGRRLSQIETEVLSWHHAQAGAWLAKKWRLAELIICGIGIHVAGPETLEDLPVKDEVFYATAFSSTIPSVLESDPSWEDWFKFLEAGYFPKKTAYNAFLKARENLLDTAKSFGLKVKEPVEPPTL